jgi:malic enzyme
MTRRDFLSASAGLAVTPVLGGGAGAATLPREADIVVIGAGAAGIAAARRIMAANRKVIVVESAAAVRPISRLSMCRSIGARAGCAIPRIR